MTNGRSPELWTIRRLLQWSSRWLAEKGIDSPRLDSEILLADALRVERLRLFLDPDRPLVAAELSAFKERIKRRAAREPVAYILGRREFWSLDFQVAAGVLVPRPETECLIETVLARFPDRSRARTLLDLGIGSGVLLLTLLYEWPQATGVGIDITDTAITYSQLNAHRLGLEQRAALLVGDLYQPLSGLQPPPCFDLIVANPPYIRHDAWPTLQPEIRVWEPAIALLAGDDGLLFYRRIFAEAQHWLAPDGLIAVEIGSDQGASVVNIAHQAGWDDATLLQDYSHRDRVVTARRSIH
ncbi:MAG: peptide chain release factor N(5)-glutamine methyltransferase [Magnetococcales bacterium]|nr:peptide chain release factor N(5)-glutamine methyltransferase [Magnetococcales bacterium]